MPIDDTSPNPYAPSPSEKQYDDDTVRKDGDFDAERHDKENEVAEKEEDDDTNPREDGIMDDGDGIQDDHGEDNKHLPMRDNDSDTRNGYLRFGDNSDAETPQLTEEGQKQIAKSKE